MLLTQTEREAKIKQTNYMD